MRKSRFVPFRSFVSTVGFASVLAGVALAGVALAGCGPHANEAHLATPAAPKATWRELETAHFVLVTDLDESAARRAIDELTSTYDVLRDVAFEDAPDATAKLQVLVFSNESDFSGFAPRGAAAYVQTLPFDPDARRVAVLWGELDEAKRPIVAHELSHILMHAKLPSTPTWLNEGYAEYASTIETTSGAAWLGRAPSRVTSAPHLELPTFATLRAMSATRFYAAHEGGKLSDAETDAIQAHYLAAWSAVHMLRNGSPEIRARFSDYVARLASPHPEKAWELAFDGVPEATLEAEYQTHAAKHFGIVWKTDYKASTPDDRIATRTLSASEVLVLEGRLAANRQPPLPFFREAERLAPNDALPHVLLARALRDAPEARREVDAAIAANPNDPEAIYLLVGALRHERLAAEPGSAPTARENELWNALGQVAKTSAQLNDFAWKKVNDGAIAVALAFSKKAVEKNPLCWPCLDTRAFALAKSGNFAAACDAERRAVDVVPEGANAAKLEAKLHQYEAEKAAHESHATEGAKAP